MSQCFLCERNIGKIKNPKCSRCNKCWFCHQATMNYHANACRFYSENSAITKPTCRVCKDQITNKNPICKSCTECLGCHVARNYSSEETGYHSCIFRIDPQPPSNKKIGTSKFKCKRLVGVEWEYHKFKNKKAVLNIIKWANNKKAGHHEDGSCLGEVVTAPIGGDNIEKQLSELGSILKENVNINHKCGIHVHVDARDIDESGMKRVISLYKKVEPLLYLLGGSERVKSTYCKPLKNSLRPKERYCGINITNWESPRPNKKTIEFRLHQGTNDAKRVIHWAQLCASLVDYAVKSDTRQINSLPLSALQIITKIYPQGKEWLLSRIREYRKENKIKDRHFSLEDGKWKWKSETANRPTAIAISPVTSTVVQVSYALNSPALTF